MENKSNVEVNTMSADDKFRFPHVRVKNEPQIRLYDSIISRV